MNQFEDIANKIIEELAKTDIKAYIWHAATTGSVYIRFEDNRMCSLRIGDHEGRKKLKYKYNLRSDISPRNKGWRKDDEIWRYYLPITLWEEIIPVLIQRHKDIQQWGPSKYKYKIPSFKK